MATAIAPVRITSTPRILALDGWRGIAVLLVLVDHLQYGLLGHHWRAWTQTGQQGVTLFFVLSGFLITGTLMKNPNLRTFYVRRFFRLMPVAWAYLALMIMLHVIHWSDVLACLFFYRNYYVLPGSPAIHFWSLSVEEQFYLFWPSILILAGVKRARWIAVFGAVACAVYRFIEWGRYDHLYTVFHTEVRMDALLVGCLLALVYPEVMAICKKLIVPALIIFAVCIFRYPWLPPLFECVAIAVIIGASASTMQGRLVRVMSIKPLVWLGTISYSLYVCQYFFCMHRPHTTTLVMVAIMPFFAIEMYRLVERPCNRLGHRLAPQCVSHE